MIHVLTPNPVTAHAGRLLDIKYQILDLCPFRLAVPFNFPALAYHFPYNSIIPLALFFSSACKKRKIGESRVCTIVMCSRFLRGGGECAGKKRTNLFFSPPPPLFLREVGCCISIPQPPSLFPLGGRRGERR